MPQSERPQKTETDPLDGFRGRPETDSYEDMESEVSSWKALADSPVNVALLQQVLKSDNLLRELNNESSTFRLLVNHALKKIDKAFVVWQLSNDPTSDKALDAHRDACAARILIDWVDEVLSVGAQTEELLQGEADDQDEG